MGYTDQEKADAVALYIEHGLAHAHHETGISKSSLQRWAEAAGHDLAEIAGRTNEKTATATAARSLALEERRLALASDLLGDVERLREQLFAPCVERKVVTIAGSAKESGSWEIVDIDRDQPTFAEQKQIMTSIAIGVDKVQVLTGAPSEIHEHRTPERTPEQEQELAKVVDLAERRAS